MNSTADPAVEEDCLQERVDELRECLKTNDDPCLPYTPFLRAVRSTTRGYAQRVPGSLTSRLHDFLSRHEFHVFLLFDWKKDEFSNIREQFAVPLGLTQIVAKRLGLRHPWDRFGKTDATMSVDFLLTKRGGGWLAVDFKEKKAASTKRTKDKMAIVTNALEKAEVPHVLMTEEDIPLQVVRNYRFLRILSLPFDPAPLGPVEIEYAERQLRSILENGRTQIFEAVRHVSKSTGLEAQVLARACYWLVANRHWRVDFYSPIGPDYPLKFVR